MSSTKPLADIGVHLLSGSSALQDRTVKKTFLASLHPKRRMSASLLLGIDSAKLTGDVSPNGKNAC